MEKNEELLKVLRALPKIQCTNINGPQKCYCRRGEKVTKAVAFVDAGNHVLRTFCSARTAGDALSMGHEVYQFIKRGACIRSGGSEGRLISISNPNGSETSACSKITGQKRSRGAGAEAPRKRQRPVKQQIGENLLDLDGGLGGAIVPKSSSRTKEHRGNPSCTSGRVRQSAVRSSSKLSVDAFDPGRRSVVRDFPGKLLLP